MSNRVFFAGQFNAVDYNYGGGVGFPPALTVLVGPQTSPLSNPGSITLESGLCVATDGRTFGPLSTNAPVIVGNGPLQERVTPASVYGNGIDSPIGQAGFTATFSNTHGLGDSVASGTFGLQEALNACAAYGGGEVVVDQGWVKAGGTSTIYAAVTVPANCAKVDRRTS